MKKKLFFLSATLVALFLISARITDNDPFADLIRKLEIYTKKYPPEKVHLHLDKPYYAIGDDIWIKAYVINARTNEPSALSKILYIDLINERNVIRKKLRLPIQTGMGWGDFKLPDTLAEGNYRIRAYTQWMRNAGAEFFFDKQIKIGNAWTNKVFTTTQYKFTQERGAEKVNSIIKFRDKTGKPYIARDVSYEVQIDSRTVLKGKSETNNNGELDITFVNNIQSSYKSGHIIATISLTGRQKVTKHIPIKATSTNVDVQFFPEGGAIVQGLPCKIGVKAINATGLGEDVSGVIEDSEGLSLATFETTYLGMGNVYVNAMPGKSYVAKINFKDGSTRTFKLPQVQQSGYVLTVNNTQEKIIAKVMLSEDLLNKGELKLVGQKNGTIYFVSRISSGKPVASFTIDKKTIPAGIIQLTLFSPQNTPVCERLAFVKNIKNDINLTVDSIKTSYGKRSPVNVSFAAAHNNNPVEGSFSISVTNADIVTPDPENETNIFTSLLLTSDLIGYVEQPNHYFLNNDQKTMAELDNLLLTQGWRKLPWKLAEAIVPPFFAYPVERSLKISGVVSRDGKAVPRGRVSILYAAKETFLIDTLTDEQGRFNFDQMSFPDTVEFIVQARTENNRKNVDIEIDFVPGQTVSRSKNTADIEVNVNESIKTYIMQSNEYFEALIKDGKLSHSILIDPITILRDKKKLAPNSSNLNGAGNADVVIGAAELDKVNSIAYFLMSRIPGLYFSNGYIFLRTSGSRFPIKTYLDGAFVDRDLLEMLMPGDIESIEVLKSITYSSIYNAPGGAIIVTTKRAENRNKNTSYYAPGMITYSPKGYSTIRQFYAPKYDVAADDLPDLRTTVYWNPHVISDSKGRANFDFYNTDQAGKYRMVIEGIDLKGNLARKVINYVVD